MEYSVKIKETTRELTKREQILFCDTTNTIKLNDIEVGNPIRIKPVDYAVLSVHNEFLKDKQDFEQYVIIDDTGARYVTGSQSFFNAFINIWEQMEGEPFEIDVYKIPSKNYKDKFIITCSIV